MMPGNLPDEAHVLGGRWVIEKALGSGGFGVVYAAFDRQRRERVALKTLHHFDPVMLARFKREFRSLADIAHTNLVTLYELVSEADHWFFTMEHVDGVDLVRYTRRATPDGTSVEIPVLRDAFRQLATGIAALHSARTLHRDLKPSNILVAANGRVVILDFGLATHIGDLQTTFDRSFGTPAYMSPEQASGGDASAASDWYSFGVVLFQALTGQLPVEGAPQQMLIDKQLRDPVRPSTIAPSVPDDLDDLCVSLLAKEPTARPTEQHILAAFPIGQSMLRAAVTSRGLPPCFVGRERELRQLRDAYQRRGSRIATVYVHGASGIGKTAVVQRFVDELDRTGKPLILQGRCYERESVPYKAFDSVIDALARHLATLPSSEIAPFIPPGIDALARIFPVLDAVLAISLVSRFGRREENAHELRRRGIAALLGLIERLSARRPIVIVIDDLQWGDLESGTLLDELLRTDHPLSVLLLLTFRNEDRTRSVCVAALPPADGAAILSVEIEPLPPDDADSLVSVLAGARELAPTAGVQADIVREARGSPLVIQELVHGSDEHLLTTFEDAIRRRIRGLGPAEQRLLAIVAIAGQPVDEQVVLHAANVDRGRAAIASLRVERFVRGAAGGAEQLVMFHDRVREAVMLSLDEPTRKEGHARLAAALENTGGATSETLAGHYAVAGNLPLAAKYTAQAAHDASRALAFDHAAKLYRRAIEYYETIQLGSHSTSTRPLMVGMAAALANAGRGLEAATAYLQASSDAPPTEQLVYRQRAAELLLHSGHIDEGLDLLRTVLADVDLEFPEITGRIPLRLIFQRIRIRLRGLAWHERAATEIPAGDLLRIDACSAAATGLALVDIACGAILQGSHLMLALRAGEPSRVARALAMEAAYASTRGSAATRRTQQLILTARQLADRTRDPAATGLVETMAAACAWNSGRWPECGEHARLASQLLLEHNGLTWERDTAAIFELDALRWMGHWREMIAALPALIADSRSRGDLYSETILQMHCGSCAALARDDPRGARSGLDVLERWSTAGFHVEHLVKLHNDVEIALYEGDGDAAYQCIEERWATLRRSLLLEVQTLRVQMHSLRARAALGAAIIQPAESAGRKRLLREAHCYAAKLKKEGVAWARGLALLLDGCVAALGGHPNLVYFDRARSCFHTSGMAMHIAVAQRCSGLISEDAALVSASDAALAAEAITKPERLSRVVAPGVCQ